MWPERTARARKNEVAAQALAITREAGDCRTEGFALAQVGQRLRDPKDTRESEQTLRTAPGAREDRSDLIGSAPRNMLE